QPLEDAAVVINRVGYAVRMPARLTLVGAMNPCVCGHLGRADRPCTCTPAMIAHYRARVSGPLLDRFEIQVEVPPVTVEELAAASPGESSQAVARRVAAARRRALEAPAPATTNAAAGILHRAVRGLGLSARAHEAIQRVARTIALLDGTPAIDVRQIAEAV